MNPRGVAFILVLAFILAVVVMANIALIIMSSQARITHHQISRIQAYYAAQAGVNYALEKLRLNNDADWPIPDSSSPYTHNLCRDCSTPDVDEPDLPLSVSNVAISVSDADDDGVIEISANADYTYSE